MIKIFEVQLSSFGFLRLSLYSLAILNTLLNLIGPLLSSPASAPESTSFWLIFATIIAPVLSVLFIVVIFLDYVMSNARASDIEDDSHQKFIAISRVNLLMIALMLAYWVPYLVFA